MEQALIHYIDPYRLQTNIPLDKVISIRFVRALDQLTINNSNFILEITPTGTKVSCGVSYNITRKEVTLTPTQLLPSCSYMVTVVGESDGIQPYAGIRDILGNGMVGNYTWTFTTGQDSRPAKPILISPSAQIAIQTQPIFSWGAVASATNYEIQVSLDNAFSQLYWPLGTDTWDTTQISVSPSRTFDDNKEYFWRVRGLAGSNPGIWSDTWSFYKGQVDHGYVSPEDEPFIDITGSTLSASPVINIYSTDPKPGSSNIDLDKLDIVTIVFDGIVPSAYINSDSIYCDGYAIDGGEFSTSRNITIIAESPADKFPITPSGTMSASINTTYLSNSTIVTLVPLPNASSYWQMNNIYEVIVDIPEVFNTILKYSFTSEYYPLWSGSRRIKSELLPFFPTVTDDDIYASIRDNSLLAAWKVISYPDYDQEVEGWNYISNLPFDNTNPPYYIREFVRYSTLIDLATQRLSGIISGIGQEKSLADLTIRYDSSLVKALTDFIDILRKKLKPFEDKVDGITRRGLANPEHTVKSVYNYNSILPLRGRVWRHSNRVWW